MFEAVERTITELEQGRVSRREAVQRLSLLLVAVAGSGVAGASSGESLFESQGLNHVALRVTDIARSREFYRTHLGLTVLQESEHNCFMAAGGNQFVALFRSDEAGMDHYCYTVKGYSADTAVARLGEAGIESRRRENRVYFSDPDGLTVQLSGEWDDYPGERPPR